MNSSRLSPNSAPAALPPISSSVAGVKGVVSVPVRKNCSRVECGAAHAVRAAQSGRGCGVET
eukprot:521384-Prymnesium_polylepis.1